MSDTDMDNFISENENVSTRKKTLSHIKLLRQFFLQIGESREPQDIPPSQLDALLSKFFASVRQKNGSEYEPSYLRGMHGSFEGFLKKSNYPISLITGCEFNRTREALKSKQKELKKQGKGNLPCRADALRDDEINILFQKGFLCPQNPQSLLNTMWFLNTFHFGIRGGGEEHRSLCWGDIEKKP